MQVIQLGQAAKDQEVRDRAGEHLGDGRTAGDVDHRFVVDELPDAQAPVGLGLALGRPPKAAQLPVAMIAAAPAAASLSRSERRACRRWCSTCRRRWGMLPSTTSTYWPAYFFMAPAWLLRPGSRRRPTGFRGTQP